MERELLHLRLWDEFTAPEAKAVAETLGKFLSPWQFEGIEEHSCGNQHRHVAFFRWHSGERFALIPGTEIQLGHDQARPLGAVLQERQDWVATTDIPTPPEDEDFASDKERDAYYELTSWCDFFHNLAKLPSPRKVVLGPYLIEATPRKCSEFGAITFADLAINVTAEGLRLPTSDEWEYACGGGSQTIWRWGDYCPEYCHEDQGDDLIHYQRNAFGLSYHGHLAELVAEPGIRRNTDGGVALCGGEGFPSGWLSLATANVRDYYARGWEKPDSKLSEWLRFRRAFKIADAMLD